MAVLLTGCAGFIGFHVARKLLGLGYQVIGIDNMNNYYDPKLKEARLAILKEQKAFRFYKISLEDREAMLKLKKNHPDIEVIINLAAQAGVRYCIENPYTFVDSNITGFLNILEMARNLKNFKHLVYASTSSVYGTNTKMPFSVQDRTDTPMAIYAVSKKCNELMAHAYAHLFQFPCTGLRFFTVYGPWGRPDMAAFIFLRALKENKSLPIFNHGKMRRNFTYIDDVVAGVTSAIEKSSALKVGEKTPFAIYNIGNDRSESLLDFVACLEDSYGKKGHYEFLDMQPGDVPETLADIDTAKNDLGFLPKVNITEGLRHLTDWYKDYYNAKTV